MDTKTIHIRVKDEDRERWRSLLKSFEGKTHELFSLALDGLERQQGGENDSLSPMQRAQVSLTSLGNALTDMAAELERAESRKQRVGDLEAFVESKDLQRIERETELHSEIHRLREDNKELSSFHKDYEALKAKYDIVVSDRTQLRRQIKKLT